MEIFWAKLSVVQVVRGRSFLFTITVIWWNVLGWKTSYRVTFVRIIFIRLPKFSLDRISVRMISYFRCLMLYILLNIPIRAQHILCFENIKRMGSVLVNNMQTTPPPPSQKEQFLFFGQQRCAIFWTDSKIYFTIFSFLNMVDQS